MAETAFEHAFKKVGVVVKTNSYHDGGAVAGAEPPPIACAEPPRRGAAVRAVAAEVLRQAGYRPEYALGPFVDRLRADGSLMADVISEASIRYDGLGFLEMVAREIK